MHLDWDHINFSFLFQDRIVDRDTLLSLIDTLKLKTNRIDTRPTEIHFFIQSVNSRLILGVEVWIESIHSFQKLERGELYNCYYSILWNSSISHSFRFGSIPFRFFPSRYNHTYIILSFGDITYITSTDTPTTYTTYTN